MTQCIVIRISKSVSVASSEIITVCNVRPITPFIFSVLMMQCPFPSVVSPWSIYSCMSRHMRKTLLQYTQHHTCNLQLCIYISCKLCMNIPLHIGSCRHSCMVCHRSQCSLVPFRSWWLSLGSWSRIVKLVQM